ncbi:right-handed parallel beta-helix repeat-containing protein [Paenibacillus nanensis]|uniref:Right-handed parallel beta-helix repeat-containing protein n=1 Tax=Paenibacillus nanensis TaxID=393251 RepID=A0A3A1VGK6_9BACL|nr:right-handed parallel beta-helix repeat-containing protein [Paenibacillus nanensis]RIX59395.1 right-handed parallel beta-helix repeat-containing protein [Paenibacillus nanensis]
MNGTHAVIRLNDFGIKPDSGEDAAVAIRMAIGEMARIGGPVVFTCDPGRYDLYPEHAAKACYPVSNTASEVENPDATKTIGIRLQGLRNVTLDGNGSLFVFHGKQTMIVVDGCEDVSIRNLRLDYERPTVTEMTVERIGENFIDAVVHKDSRYELENGALTWVGEGWRFRDGPMQEYDPLTNTTWRIGNIVMAAARIEEREPGRLRLIYAEGWLPQTAVGRVFQARDGIRDQVGALIVGSRKVAWRDFGVHFMHGLGLVCQFSEDVTFERMELAPRADTGRTAAAFADCIHASGCRGLIRVANSRFAGAHDDVINVHGTYLRVAEQPSEDELILRFMHPQTYGFPAFFAGDVIAFVRSESLISYGEAVVEEAELVEPRVMRIKLDRRPPKQLRAGDVIENVTWTPEVEIVGNRMARIPTRGILVTTRRRALIEGNFFERMTMSAVLVACDASSWFESGIVTDLTIRGNSFLECGHEDAAVISISPEIATAEEGLYVHSGITIEGNRFDMCNAPLLEAGCSEGLIFANNLIVGADRGGEAGAVIRLAACDKVSIVNNRYTWQSAQG